MASKQRAKNLPPAWGSVPGTNSASGGTVPISGGIAAIEHAVRPELMTFDLAGQRARELEIIRLLSEILKAVSDGK